MKLPLKRDRFLLKIDPNELAQGVSMRIGERKGKDNVLRPYIGNSLDGILMEDCLLIPTNLIRYNNKWYRPNCFTMKG